MRVFPVPVGKTTSVFFSFAVLKISSWYLRGLMFGGSMM